MKKLIGVIGLLLSAMGAHAAEYGRVISSVPVVQNVSTPQRNCWEEDVVVRQPASNGGAIVGGVIGAIVGNSFGRGSGNAAATAAGAVVGAVAGSNLDQPRSDLQTVRRCETRESTQTRTIGYDVTYEYAGQRYTSRMPNDPGEWVPVRVNVESTASRSVQDQADIVTEPIEAPPRRVRIVEEAPVVVYRSGYYAPPPPPVYFSVGIHRDWGYWHRDYYHHHR